MNTQEHFEFINFPDEASKQKVKETFERLNKGHLSGHPSNEECKPLKPLTELILRDGYSIDGKHYIDIETIKENSNWLDFTYDYPGLECLDQEGLVRISISASIDGSTTIRLVSVDPETWDGSIKWNVQNPSPGFKFYTFFKIVIWYSDREEPIIIVGPRRDYELR
ncbi:hypothetical protein ACJA3S_05505 [Pseudomonas sp. KnCO4]|uniref:hypothetical protein n=1 Tax=Pseudomonas sp. KnCO4 TaxID=3381355 RepID=UPI0038781155